MKEMNKWIVSTILDIFHFLVHNIFPLISEAMPLIPPLFMAGFFLWFACVGQYALYLDFRRQRRLHRIPTKTYDKKPANYIATKDSAKNFSSPHRTGGHDKAKTIPLESPGQDHATTILTEILDKNYSEATPTEIPDKNPGKTISPESPGQRPPKATLTDNPDKSPSKVVPADSSDKNPSGTTTPPDSTQGDHSKASLSDSADNDHFKAKVTDSPEKYDLKAIRPDSPCKNPPETFIPNSPSKDLTNAVRPNSADNNPEDTQKCAHSDRQDGSPAVMQELDDLKKLLQEHGDSVEKAGTACRDKFWRIHKEQKDHWEQYRYVRKQYAEHFASIASILQGKTMDIAHSSRVTGELSNSFYNIVEQYREMAVSNYTFFHDHVFAIIRTLEAHNTALDRSIELADSNKDDSIQNALRILMKVIEANTKLIREHGTPIDKIVSDHTDLTAEYENAINALTQFITANGLLTLMHAACDWEPLGRQNSRIDCKGLGQVDDQSLQLTLGKGGTKKGHKLGISSAQILDNLRQMARKLRIPSDEVRRKPEGAMQTTVETPHSEQMNLLHKVREEVKKLRSFIGDLEEMCRQRQRGQDILEIRVTRRVKRREIHRRIAGRVSWILAEGARRKQIDRLFDAEVETILKKNNG